MLTVHPKDTSALARKNTMPRVFFAVALLSGMLLTAVPASGSIVTNFQLTNAEGDNTFVGSSGSSGAFTDSGVGATRTFTYQVTGLDLTGDSTANDIATFTMIVTGNNNVVLSGDGNAENSFGVSVAGVDGNFQTNEIDPGESITFAAGGTNVSFGDPTSDVANVTFNGFIGLESFFVDGDDNHTLTGATINMLARLPGSGSTGEVETFDSLSASSFTLNNGAPGNGFLVGNLGLDFTIDVVRTVPAPNSLALLGIGALLFTFKRRRD